MRARIEQPQRSAAARAGCPVDEAHADANCKDGVLALRLPKKAAAARKRLVIP